jgi:glycine C-acetyltransferase
MTPTYLAHLRQTLAEIAQAGFRKRENPIDSPQSAHVALADGQRVLNFCANNYLGLADHPEVIRAAHEALDRWGYGVASVRFICGTQTIHQELESRLSAFLGTDDTILFSSCFDANGGVFETLLGAEDAVISDELNHASIIDGIRLSRARRFRYKNRDLADLEARLREVDTGKARFKLIVTDGVFSMDGFLAPLREICDLAEKYGALVVVDDSHGAGVLGPTGRGTPEHCGVAARIDIFTGTLGKSLGGASGGYVSGRREIVELLRQRARPYLFSNSLAPAITAGSLKALEIVSRSTELRDRLAAHTQFFRAELERTGLTVRPGVHPIVPVMIGDAALSQKVAARMLEKGIYVVGFFYPVVPQGTARIRAQVSAAHSHEDLESAVQAFAEVKQEFGL